MAEISKLSQTGLNTANMCLSVFLTFGNRPVILNSLKSTRVLSLGEDRISITSFQDKQLCKTLLSFKLLNCQ